MRGCAPFHPVGPLAPAGPGERPSKPCPRPRPPMTRASAEGTAALDKALDVLDAVGQAGTGLSQAELSARLNLPRTTLYRLLGTLVARGLLRRDPLRRVYCLGFRCYEYARNAHAMPDLVAAAALELRALRDMTGETTYLATIDGLEAVGLERCDGAHERRSQSAPGSRKPLHCTSQGKAMLSALPAERRDALVRELPMTAVTPRSITDRRRLQAELRLIATRGWSIDDEEYVPGTRCCGAPIVDADGTVRGAISVAGPTFRLTMDRVELIGPEVAEAARRIGAQLSQSSRRQAEGAVHLVPGEWAFEGAHLHWSVADGALWWVDTLAPSVHRATRDGDAQVAVLDAPIQAAVPAERGLTLQVGERWFQVSTASGLQALAGLPQRRLSAAARSPAGDFTICVSDGDRWEVSVIGDGGRSTGSWRLNEPVTALAWDAAGERLVMAAADSGTLYVARPGQPQLRRLATVPKGSGRLSGLALDREGGVWSALRGGWSVARFEADGGMDRVIALPVPCPSDLGFGGVDGRTLFVASARDAVSRESLDAAPLSGRLFAVDAGVAGVLP